MRFVRNLVAQRRLATLICAAALLLKLLIPAGFMIDSTNGRLSVIVCLGAAPRPVAMAMPGRHGDRSHHAAPSGHGQPSDHGKPELPCAFAGLSAATTGPVDPIQLAALIAFVLALGLAAATLPAPAPFARLRPPLRGPPAVR
ncbi:hypothetical protein [Sphingomonas corticis]|uniref:DUF2946 domain-containing protein n=1 Tax=Sphingomonas corticis TaxID=2722791 RepID=A0ABX1CKU7_9SPHN|nr:hypothetical protein [Sphingomonas corticis]